MPATIVERSTNTIIAKTGFEFGKPLGSGDLNEIQSRLANNVIEYLNGPRVTSKAQIGIIDSTITSTTITLNSFRYCVVDANKNAYYGSINPTGTVITLTASETDSDIYLFWRAVELTPESTVYLNGIRTNANQSSIQESTTTNNIQDTAQDTETTVRWGLEITFDCVARGDTAPTLSGWSTGVKISELTFTNGAGKLKDVDPPAAGGSEIDDAFSLTSENPVQNKVVATAVTQGRLSKVNITRLEFTNVSVATSDWSTSGDYVRAALTLTGVTTSMTPTVLYSVEDATGGVLLPTAESYAGGVYIYALETPEATITIPLIQCDLVES